MAQPFPTGAGGLSRGFESTFNSALILKAARQRKLEERQQEIDKIAAAGKLHVNEAPPDVQPMDGFRR